MHAKKHDPSCPLIGFYRAQTDSGYSWAVNFHQSDRVIRRSGLRSLEAARTTYTRWKGKS